ncbi:hypothetical protein GW796_06425 [archaeon]|nr:hypothetical protein [archaeon]
MSNENIKIMPLNKNKFDKMMDGDITIKEMKDFSLDISNRFLYVVEKISELTNRTCNWCDYSNEVGEGNTRGMFNGFFDTSLYSNEVDYVGSFYNPKEHVFKKYDTSFPTSWLVENFEDKLKVEINNYLEYENKKIITQKNTNEEINKKLQEIQSLIKAKLTVEELCFVKFLPINEVNQNMRHIKKEKSLKINDLVKELQKSNIDVKSLYSNYKNEQKEKAKNFIDWLTENKKQFKEKITQQNNNVKTHAIFSLYAIEWEESERGWGTRPDGFSFHRSVEEAEEYLKDFISKQPKEVPDEYSRPVGKAKLMEVSEDLHEFVMQSGSVWLVPNNPLAYKTYDATHLKKTKNKI